MANKTPNLNEIVEMAKVAESILNGKEYFIGTVAQRLNTVAQKYPHDQAIRLMQTSMQKRFEKEGSLSTISQREFQNLYDEVSGLGNLDVLSSEFNDLLLNPFNRDVAHYNNEHVSSMRGDGEQYDVADQDLVIEFETLFGEPSDKLVHSSFVDNGRKGVELELTSMGFANPSVEVAEHNSEFVVYAVEVPTRIGRVSFLIPAEIKLGSALLPSVFVSGNDFKDFTKANIIQHAQNNANAKLATPKTVLDTLAKMKGTAGVHKTASAENFDADYLLESPGLYHELPEEGPAHGGGLDFIQVDVPEPLKGLTDDVVKETLMEAGLSFDRDLVLKAKQALVIELKGMGFRPDTVKIASEYSEGVVLSTAIVGKGGKKSIEVPVEIKNGRILMPSTFTSGVVAKSFTEQNLKSFADEREAGQFNAFFSDKNHMNFDELYNRSLQSATFGNFLEVEECLAVIDSKFGSSYHKLAFDDLMGLVRLGFNTDCNDPLDEIDQYIKEAADELRHKEANVKMSNSLLYLYPEDD